MLEVSFTPFFVRVYSKLPANLQKEVDKKIKLFKNKDQHKSLKVHKLHGRLNACFSFSVNQNFRIVFQYLSSKEALLIDLGNHDVYK